MHMTNSRRRRNRSAVIKTQRIGITHHAHILALGRTGENLIVRVARNLLEQDYGGLSVLHKSRLDVA